MVTVSFYRNTHTTCSTEA